MITRTKPAPHYIPPSPSEIKEAAAEAGLTTYSPQTVIDMANVASGGEVVPPSEFMDAVNTEARSKVGEDAAGYSYSAYFEGKEYTEYADSRAEAVRSQISNDMQYHRRACDFIQELDFQDAPGQTPLGKAVSMLKMLETVAGGKPGDSDSNILPVLTEFEASSATDAANRINELTKHVRSLTDAEKALLGFSDDKLSEPSRSDDLSPADKQELEWIKSIKQDQDIWLHISRRLDKLSRMTVSKHTKLVADREGDETHTRQITGFDELNKMRQMEWALPSTYRVMRVVNHAPSIRERARRVSKKQLLYLLVDCSISMQSGGRIAKALGILMNRLKAVYLGDAEVYVRCFDDKLYEEHAATSPEAAVALMKQMGDQEFNGRYTAIAKCVKETAKRIDEMMSQSEVLTRPEMVVVTDGADNVSSLKRSHVGVTTVHAFVVEHVNRDLANFARSTGGSAIENL